MRNFRLARSAAKDVELAAGRMTELYYGDPVSVKISRGKITFTPK